MVIVKKMLGEEKDKQGHTPREMMLDFVNADLQHDYKTIRKLSCRWG